MYAIVFNEFLPFSFSSFLMLFGFCSVLFCFVFRGWNVMDESVMETQVTHSERTFPQKPNSQRTKKYIYIYLFSKANYKFSQSCEVKVLKATRCWTLWRMSAAVKKKKNVRCADKDGDKVSDTRLSHLLEYALACTGCSLISSRAIVLMLKPSDLTRMKSPSHCITVTGTQTNTSFPPPSLFNLHPFASKCDHVCSERRRSFL